MSYDAYAYNINKDEEAIIRQMIAIITNEPGNVYDLRSYKPECDFGDIILVFGERAKRACEGLKCKAVLEFPDVSRLVAGFGDEDERVLAYQKLLDFKGAMADTQESAKKRTVINEETLPPLDSAQVLLALRAALSSQGVEAWEGVTRNGSKFRITIEPENVADINLTFAELFMIQAAMTTLQCEELEIVYKSSGNRESSTR